MEKSFWDAPLLASLLLVAFHCERASPFRCSVQHICTTNYPATLGWSPEAAPAFLRSILQMPTQEEALAALLQPLDAVGGIADVLRDVKAKLLCSVKSGRLRVPHVLQELSHYRHLEPVKLATMALKGVYDSLQVGCPFRAELQGLIYNVSVAMGLNVHVGRRPGALLATRGCECDCNLDLIEYLVDRLVLAEARISCLSRKPGACASLSNQEAWQFPYAQVITLAPTLITQEDAGSVELLGSFLSDSELASILASLNFPTGGDRRQRLLGMAQTLTQSPSLGVDVASWTTVVGLLPKPKSEKESAMLNVVKAFLQSPNALPYSQNLDLDRNADRRELVLALFASIGDGAQSPEVKTAFTYYHHRLTLCVLAESLPKPADAEEEAQLVLVGQFLQTPQAVALADSVNFTALHDRDALLAEILEAIAESGGGLGEETHVAFVCVHRRVVLTHLQVLLPKPAGGDEEALWNAVVEYMHSAGFFAAHKELNVTGFVSEEELLLYVLEECASATDLDVNLQAACKYYYVKLAADRLVGLFPKAEDESQRLRLQLIAEFLRSASALVVLQGVSFHSHASDVALLESIAMAAASAPGLSEKLREAFAYCYRRLVFAELVHLLPKPDCSEEAAKYALVRDFFESGATAVHLGGIDVSLYANKRVLLKVVLKTLTESDVAPALLQAFKYYLDCGQGKIELDLHAQKVIRKRFDLTAILSEVFDFHTLTVEQRGAFNDFFEYLGGPGASKLGGFAEWSEAKTKGEFVEALLRHVSEKRLAPPKLVSEIDILVPLVARQGHGADPLRK